MTKWQVKRMYRRDRPHDILRSKTEGEQGEVVVRFCAVAETVCVGLQSLYTVTAPAGRPRGEQLDNAIVALLLLLTVLGCIESVGVEQHHTVDG